MGNNQKTGIVLMTYGSATTADHVREYLERIYNGKVSEEGIAESIAIAELVVKHEPFRGFNVGARRKSARRPAAALA